MDGGDRGRSTPRSFDDIRAQRRRMHEDQAAYSDDSQFGTPVQSSPMAYSDYSPQPGHRQPLPPFPSYTSNMMYNLPQSPPATSQAYNSIQSYPAHRQNAAIEVLSSQFGMPQYFVPDPQATGASQTSHQAQYYQAPNSPPRMSYTSTIHELTQQSTMTEPVVPTVESNQQSQSPDYEEAYARYQNAVRATFMDMRDGKLVQAGTSLLSLSEWLLTSAVELGLVRDDANLYPDRTKMWNEFNVCWLSVLAREKEFLQEMISGQQLQPPRDIIREETLQKMGSELIRLCDGMERHGLVDYQMGVWEEEILDSIQECLDLLEQHFGPLHTS